MEKRKGVGLEPLPQTSSVFAYEREKAKYAEQVVQRMHDLADRLGARQGEHRWRDLAVMLAMQYVPELMTNKPRNRPKLWGPSLRAELLAEMNAELAGGLTQIAAAAKLSRKAKWKEHLKPWGEGHKAKSTSKSISGQEGEALVRHYRQAVKEMKEEMKEMKALNAARLLVDQLLDAKRN
jgi:hypothetical protein